MISPVKYKRLLFLVKNWDRMTERVSDQGNDQDKILVSNLSIICLKKHWTNLLRTMGTGRARIKTPMIAQLQPMN